MLDVEWPMCVDCSRPPIRRGDIEEVESVNEDGSINLVGYTFEHDDFILSVAFNRRAFREVQPPDGRSLLAGFDDVTFIL